MNTNIQTTKKIDELVALCKAYGVLWTLVTITDYLYKIITNTKHIGNYIHLKKIYTRIGILTTKKRLKKMQ